jgi:hypothetical protein
VFLPGGRVFDGLYTGFGNTRDPNSRTPFLAIDNEGDRGEERLNQIGADGGGSVPGSGTSRIASASQLDLETAQSQIASNWIEAYKKYVRRRLALQ